MSKHSHKFVDNYDGIGAFGLDRKSDEETIIYYLQKFSDDEVMKNLVPRLSDNELSEIYDMINKLLRSGFSENEYHNLFLKDDTHK